jgi:hypothetical protein
VAEVALKFFVGLHQPSDAQHFDRAFISVNRLRMRKGAFKVNDWIMDSGAFTEIATYGEYRHDVSNYAAEIRRWRNNGNLRAAVAQDWMCEPWIIRKTGLSVEEHQRRTIERYDALMAEDPGVSIIPVLQGYAPGDYLDHLTMYGDRLPYGAWVGVGSICKRNGSPIDVLNVLGAIKYARPNLRLHGFGVKSTALKLQDVRELLESADSMAWSSAARWKTGKQNDYREAKKWVARIERDLTEWRQGWQMPLL